MVNKTDLLFRYDSPSDAPHVDVRSSVERVLNEIEQYLGLQRAMIQAYNQGLANQSAQCIEQRRTRLLAQSERVAALGNRKELSP